MLILASDGTFQPVAVAPSPAAQASPSAAASSSARDYATGGDNPLSSSSNTYYKILLVSTWIGMLLGTTLFVFYALLTLYRAVVNRAALMATFHKYVLILILSVLLVVACTFVQSILPPM